jgi:hypothetical protein
MGSWIEGPAPVLHYDSRPNSRLVLDRVSYGRTHILDANQGQILILIRGEIYGSHFLMKNSGKRTMREKIFS